MERNYDNRFPNSGSLHLRDSKGSQDRGPQMTGNITLSDDVLEYVVNEARQGARDVKLDISAWSKSAYNSGKRFYSLNVRLPWELRKDQEQGGDRRNDRRDDRYADRRDDRRDYDRRDDRRRDGLNDVRDQYSRVKGDEPDERRQYGGRTSFRSPPRRETISDEEFAKGDEMPDFGRSDDPTDPPW